MEEVKESKGSTRSETRDGEQVSVAETHFPFGGWVL
jgi:hypothetical protein